MFVCAGNPIRTIVVNCGPRAVAVALDTNQSEVQTSVFAVERWSIRMTFFSSLGKAINQRFGKRSCDLRGRISWPILLMSLARMPFTRKNRLREKSKSASKTLILRSSPFAKNIASIKRNGPHRHDT
jgi:hypothetical protein